MCFSSDDSTVFGKSPKKKVRKLSSTTSDELDKKEIVYKEAYVKLERLTTEKIAELKKQLLNGNYLAEERSINRFSIIFFPIETILLNLVISRLTNINSLKRRRRLSSSSTSSSFTSSSSSITSSSSKPYKRRKRHDLSAFNTSESEWHPSSSSTLENESESTCEEAEAENFEYTESESTTMKQWERLRNMSETESGTVSGTDSEEASSTSGCVDECVKERQTEVRKKRWKSMSLKKNVRED